MSIFTLCWGVKIHLCMSLFPLSNHPHNSGFSSWIMVNFIVLILEKTQLSHSPVAGIERAPAGGSQVQSWRCDALYHFTITTYLPQKDYSISRVWVYPIPTYPCAVVILKHYTVHIRSYWSGSLVYSIFWASNSMCGISPYIRATNSPYVGVTKSRGNFRPTVGWNSTWVKFPLQWVVNYFTL